MFQKIVDCSYFADFFCGISAHHKISTIYTSQSYYTQGRYAKAISRCSTDRIIFHDKSDITFLGTIATQQFPKNPSILLKSMAWVCAHTEKSWERYLWLDNSPLSNIPRELMIRSNIFPDEKTNRIEPWCFLE